MSVIGSMVERLSSGPRAFIARVASRRKLAVEGETYERLLELKRGTSSSGVPDGVERDPLLPSPTGVEGRGRYVHGWLLWLGIASVACLPPLGVPTLLALAVAGLFVLCWIATNIALKSLVCSFIYLALEIFFREIGSRNTYKVPPEGQPCLFVCAPHANQFLDPFVVMMALGRQDIHFLTAAASMRKWYVRYIANLLGVIPVERPQDGTVQGTGRVTPSPDDRSVLLGLGTRFRTELKPGDTLSWAAEGGYTAGCTKGVVAEVLSDEAVRLKAMTRPPGQAGMWAGGAEMTRSVLSGMAEGDAFKITPHIDQASMFSAVTSVLAAGQSVGIFPEGGSHDRTSLLPLKAGMAVMALGTMAAHPGLQLKLVPIGLHYFSGHKFRSRVFLDIGEPLDVPPELLDLYRQDGESKRRATNALMRVIETALAAVTVSAPDFDTLQFFWTLRRLIKTGSGVMSISQQVEFARRFAAAHEKLVAQEAAREEQEEDAEAGKPHASSQTDEVARLKQMSAEYNATLKSFGLRDYQVVRVMSHMGRGRAASLLALRTVMLVVFVVCIAPMAVLGLPLFIPRWYATRRARLAVASSSVKLEGKDVLATWKVLIAVVLIPLMWIGYTATVCVFGATWGLSSPWDYEACLLFFFFSPFVFYGAVLAGDHMTLVVRSLAPLATVILYPDARWALVEQRRCLMQAMQALVDEHGWLEPDSRLGDAAAGSACGSFSHPGSVPSSGYASST